MNPLLVILDLDETLVHSAEQPLDRAADLSFGAYYCYWRPHLTHFLDVLHAQHRVAVWTSAGRLYAEEIVHAIIPWHAELAFFWYAEQCTNHFDRELQTRTVIKKLSKVKAKGYGLDRVLVLDDSPEKHVLSYGNLVRVAPFVGDPSDDELLAVLPFLETLATCVDVRTVEKRGWRHRVPAR